MLTIAKMQMILSEKDADKRQAMIDALPEEEKEKLRKEAERIAEEGRKILGR